MDHQHQSDAPLSEEEQDLLFDIEERLSRSDPQFAARIGRRRPTRLPIWVTPAGLLALGAGLMLAAVSASLLIASAGAVIFAGGVAATIDRWPPPKVRSPRSTGDRRWT